MLVVTQRLYEAPRVCDSSVPLDVLVEPGTAYLALQSVSTMLGLMIWKTLIQQLIVT